VSSSRASHRLRVNRVIVVAKPKRKVRLEFNSRRAVRPDLPLHGSSHDSAGREGQTYFPLNVTSCGVSCAMRSANGRDQLLFGSFPDVRRAECFYRPMVTLFMSDECADTDNRVVDVLWELVAECPRIS